MKKILLSLFFVILAFSCEETPYNTFSDYYAIHEDQWRWDNYESYYYCEIRVPELTSYVFENGVISTYYITEVDKREVAYPLPYDYYEVEQGGFRWTEQNTCEIRPGYITFIVKYNTRDNTYRPLGRLFKVNMIW